MPIVFKKHFGDSDDDKDLDLFLEQPPEKKRKLNNEKCQPINLSAKTERNKKDESKGTLTKLRLKRTKKRVANFQEFNPRLVNNKNNKSKKNKNPIISFESIKPNDIAISFQTLFLKTFKTTTEDLGFKFKPSHFVEVTTKNTPRGSLDILQHFLRNYFSNTVQDNDTEENPENLKKSKEWIACTKSMQVMVISPSVRKAVDTIKALRTVKVKHSFVHKKELNKMSVEEYEEYEQNKDENVAVIGLRVCELFGKHRTIKFQKNELINKSWHCGVGGINRINKLFQSKHLTLKKCELIVIDLQRNVKTMSILDMKQVCKELCQWLQEYAFTRINNKHTKIAFF